MADGVRFAHADFSTGELPRINYAALGARVTPPRDTIVRLSYGINMHNTTKEFMRMMADDVAQKSKATLLRFARELACNTIFVRINIKTDLNQFGEYVIMVHFIVMFQNTDHNDDIDYVDDLLDQMELDFSQLSLD